MYVFKGGKFLYPNNIHIFNRILQKYPDGIGYAKYIPAFMFAACEALDSIQKRSENMQWLRSITLENVEEYEDVDGNKLKYPVEMKEPKPFKNQFLGLLYITIDNAICPLVGNGDR